MAPSLKSISDAVLTGTKNTASTIGRGVKQAAIDSVKSSLRNSSPALYGIAGNIKQAYDDKKFGDALKGGSKDTESLVSHELQGAGNFERIRSSSMNQFEALTTVNQNIIRLGMISQQHLAISTKMLTGIGTTNARLENIFNSLDSSNKLNSRSGSFNSGNRSSYGYSSAPVNNNGIPPGPPGPAGSSLAQKGLETAGELTAWEMVKRYGAKGLRYLKGPAAALATKVPVIGGLAAGEYGLSQMYGYANPYSKEYHAAGAPEENQELSKLQRELDEEEKNPSPFHNQRKMLLQNQIARVKNQVARGKGAMQALQSPGGTAPMGSQMPAYGISAFGLGGVNPQPDQMAIPSVNGVPSMFSFGGSGGGIDSPTNSNSVFKGSAGTAGASPQFDADAISKFKPISAGDYTGTDPSQLPLGMRVNNPGNIKYTGEGWQKNFPGISKSTTTDQGDAQAAFSSPHAGMAAAATLALKKYSGGKTSIYDLISGKGGWTPGKTDAAEAIAKRMGLDPSADARLSEPGQMKSFLKNLTLEEHGQASAKYKDDVYDQAIDSVLGKKLTASERSDLAGTAVDNLAKMEGKHERVNRQEIMEYLRTGGVNMDPATTAWCAAAVNASLAQSGIKGSGSQVANSFQKWGAGVDPSQGVKKGDVIVESHGLGPGVAGGHVSLATGNTRTDKNGQLMMEAISGNHSDMVKRDWVPANRNNMVRRATDNLLPPKKDEPLPAAVKADKPKPDIAADLPEGSKDNRRDKAPDDTPTTAPEAPWVDRYAIIKASTGDDLMNLSKPSDASSTPSGGSTNVTNNFGDSSTSGGNGIGTREIPQIDPDRSSIDDLWT